MGARNRVGIGFSYRPDRLHTQPGGILGLHISLKIRALVSGSVQVPSTIFFEGTASWCSGGGGGGHIGFNLFSEKMILRDRKWIQNGMLWLIYFYWATSCDLGVKVCKISKYEKRVILLQKFSMGIAKYKSLSISNPLRKSKTAHPSKVIDRKPL